MASPSASLTENRLDSAIVWLATMVLLAVVTTGGVLGVVVTVKGDQGMVKTWLQSTPSKARICRLSPTVPATKEVWLTFPLHGALPICSGWATPLTTK